MLVDSHVRMADPVLQRVSISVVHLMETSRRKKNQVGKKTSLKHVMALESS